MGPAPVARGTYLSVQLSIEELVPNPTTATILWEGEIGNASFPLTVPKGAKRGRRTGLIEVRVNEFRIALLYFTVDVGWRRSRNGPINVQEKRHRTAFASYASADRDAVLARIQGIQKAAPQLDVFVDVLKLRSGQYWAEELWKEIPSRDVFYLFWSQNAMASAWVEKEWRCALETRGLDFIDPVPLQPPDKAPPPQELASKHFNDWVLAFMSQGKKSDQGKAE